MPKAWLIQTNFAGGESTPLLRGRTDIPRYASSCETILNAYCMAKGGVKRRPGTRFVYNTGTGINSRIIPFLALRTDMTPMQQKGYIVEIRNDGKMRFYTDGAIIAIDDIPVEIEHPYSSTELPGITYETFEGSLYICSGSKPPKKLTRTSDTVWTLTDMTFQTKSGMPVMHVTRSSTTVTCDLGSIEHKLSTGDYVLIAGAEEADYNGKQSITKVDNYKFTYTIATSPASPATGSVTAQPYLKSVKSDGTKVTVQCARDHDLYTGQFVNMSTGTDEYNGTFQVTVTGKKSFTYAPAECPAAGSASGDKVYSIVLFDATTGYPGAITFYQQRLILAGARMKPTTIWCSKNGDIYDMITGSEDNDAMEIVMADAKSMIMHLASHNLIGVMTADKEFTLQGSSDKALSPTNLQIKGRSIYGSSSARPITMGEEIIYITRNKKRLRTLFYQFDSDSYKSPDIAIVSNHLSELGMEDMAYSTEPESMAWIVTTDGRLLTVTIDRDQEIISWAQHQTDGLFKGVAVIPSDNQDQVWVLVERTLNGQTVTCMEYLDSSLMTDCAVTQVDNAGKETWTGLEQLEGETVDIVADGIVQPQLVVSGGSITLPRAAQTVEIGLHYQTKVKDLPPEFQTGEGTAQGKAVSVSKIVVRLHETIGCSINGEAISFRQIGADPLDTDISPFTGDKKIGNIGWDNGTVEIIQDQPLPFTCLAIIKEVTAN